MKDSFAGIIIRFFVNAAAIYVAAQVIPGIHLSGWEATLFVTVIFGLVNAFIKPFVNIASCLLYILTLGLFTFIVNGAMLYLTAWLAGKFNLEFSIDNFISAFLGALIVSIVSFILSKLLRI